MAHGVARMMVMKARVEDTLKIKASRTGQAVVVFNSDASHLQEITFMDNDHTFGFQALELLPAK
ncbi:MAG TPA: hypothetical protein VHS31_11470, partial [Tepidisphaeraceae bacterium]|nr:hypothetical protein [Tepidisphaeraceae bacterium]